VGGIGVPGGTAQRLQRAEIHGGLDLLGVAADPVSFHRHGDRGPARLGVQGRGDAHVRQQRRVDAAGQLAKAAQRPRDLRRHLVQQRLRPRLVVIERAGRAAELAGQAGQIPLRAIAEVAFQPLPLGVLGRDQAFP